MLDIYIPGADPLLFLTVFFGVPDIIPEFVSVFGQFLLTRHNK
jgi:hypothetical protein